jgi:hypothetical protein
MQNPKMIESDELRKSLEAVSMSDPVRRMMGSAARPSGIADLMKSAESAFLSDPTRKLMESMARRSGIADSMKSTESAFLSDSTRKLMESMARPSGITDLMKSTESAFLSDSTRKLMESMARPSGIADPMKSTESAFLSHSTRKLMESMARPSGIPDLMKSIETVGFSGRPRKDGMVAPADGISGELRRSLEHTAQLASSVDRSLSNVALPFRHRENNKLPVFPAPEPNPIWQTNSHLSELTATVTQLVDVARQQAELSQAIRGSADLALKYAVQSGEEAKAATVLARKSVGLTLIAIVVAIIAAVAGIAVNYYLNNSTDVRLREEIRMLGDISHKLQQINDRPVTNPAVAPKPQAQPYRGSQPANGR